MRWGTAVFVGMLCTGIIAALISRGSALEDVRVSDRESEHLRRLLEDEKERVADLMSAVERCAGAGCDRELWVRPSCFFTDREVHFFTEIRATYASGSTSRKLWSFTCSTSTRECEGASLDIDQIVEGEMLDEMSIGSPRGARLLSATKSSATIDFPTLRRFVIDFERDRVFYSEFGRGFTGAMNNGTGDGPCSLPTP